MIHATLQLMNNAGNFLFLAPKELVFKIMVFRNK